MMTHRGVDVGDVKVTDENGLLSYSMVIKAMNTIMGERLCVAGQFAFQPLLRDRPARSSFSLCILTLAPILHLDFYQRTVTDEMRSLWNLRIDVFSKCSQEFDHSREEN